MNQKSLFILHRGIFKEWAGLRATSSEFRPAGRLAAEHHHKGLLGDSLCRSSQAFGPIRIAGDAAALLRAIVRPKSRAPPILLGAIALHVTGKDAPHADSLATCNANASFCMRLCTARSSHFYRAKFILKLRACQRSIVAQTPAMMPRLSYEKGKVT